ncbi:MAG: hypothetical protein J7K88_06135 [Candidatus Fermentibacteraceae bacterium]|nr:hypothetical protein [Candidatus Fermentibacteraceae bacterium]
MADSFEMQRRYYTALLEKYATNPELNRARIKDCEYYLGMMDEAGSSEVFIKRVKETGNMVSTAKAESTDRYENRLFIYEKLGEEKKAEEDRLRLAVIESADSHIELSEKLEKFETEAKLNFNENKAITALGTVVSAVFQLATDGAGSADEKRSRTNAEAGWKMMLEADPEATWEKIVSYPPYRDRIIFADAQLPVLEKIFREVCHG